ncbi:MAG: hypothetical protein BKP49_07765 [Treponema sp. CETP13]|nr:MAG: hypothetical protein BKP49_07765 [Treponema sp. CETP13]
MKKMILAIAVAIMLLPASLFAEPSEEEVENTISSVMAIYGMSMMASMLGVDIPEGALVIEYNEDRSGSTLNYKDFPAKEFLENMNSMSSMMEETSDEEQLVCPFTIMNGTVATNGSMFEDGNIDLNIDVNLQGGNVKTLEMHTNDDDVIVKVNGLRNYDMEEILKRAELDDEGY